MFKYLWQKEFNGLENKIGAQKMAEIGNNLAAASRETDQTLLRISNSYQAAASGPVTPAAAHNFFDAYKVADRKNEALPADLVAQRQTFVPQQPLARIQPTYIPAPAPAYFNQNYFAPASATDGPRSAPMPGQTYSVQTVPVPPTAPAPYSGRQLAPGTYFYSAPAQGNYPPPQYFRR